jgi:hypothetical protein
MNWLLRPPIVLGGFERRIYGRSNSKSNRDALRLERLKYWDPAADYRSPKAQLYGFLTGVIIWIASTFMGAVPLLGWMIRIGVPVPAMLFEIIIFMPLAMLLYIGIMIPVAPIKSSSIGWVVALSWPVEVVIALLGGLAAWLVW